MVHPLRFLRKHSYRYSRLKVKISIEPITTVNILKDANSVILNSMNDAFV